MISGSCPHSSSMNGICSPCCCITNLRLHRPAIFKKVSHAMSCTPGWVFGGGRLAERSGGRRNGSSNANKTTQ